MQATPVDSASVSSCSTVKDQQNSPPLSPSPITETFVTPLQTPSALTFEQGSAQSKKAQKRREQRKKQREQAAAMKEDDEEAASAFTEQMNQIAYLSSAKASRNRQSYYDQARNEHSPTTATASPTTTEKVLATIRELEAKKTKGSIPATKTIR